MLHYYNGLVIVTVIVIVNIMMFLDKDGTMDNVRKHNSCMFQII
jgi:hypothetical protein